MRAALMAILLFAGNGRGRLGRSIMDVPRERMFLYLQMPVSERFLVTGALGLPTRAKDARDRALARDREPHGLLVSAGVQFYFD